MARILEGKVISVPKNKTVIVEVIHMYVHPLYKKRIKRSKKYSVHYEGTDLKAGDTVRIVETRPISKNKHFKIVTK